jgi:hypothetical protein
MVLKTRDIYMQIIRQRLGTFLDDTCTIKRSANSSDETGADTGTKIIVAEDVACRIIEGKSDIGDIGDQLSLTEWYRLILPVGTELGTEYTVTLGNGDVFQVIDILTQRTDATDVQAVIKRRVR